MGSIYKQKESHNYWIKYYRGGKAYRESTGSDKKSVAERLLKLREGAVAEGKFPGLNVLKIRVKELVDLYLKDYKNNNRKSMKEAERYAHLIKEYFGEMRAANLTTGQIMDYRAKRKEEGVQDATINRELSALRRMYHLGQKHTPPLVSRVPNIEIVKEHNVRKGFFEVEDFLALRGALPDHLKVAITIGYYTGMRLAEILSLQWDHIDWDHGMLRLDPGTTKNYEGRIIPMTSEVRKTLEQWRMTTIEKWPKCPLVCHLNGNKIVSMYAAWRSACKRVGLEGRLFHDLRRSAVRNLVRAGVPQAVAKKISGHKTDSVFNRYNIVSQGDLLEATEKLSDYINGKRSISNDGHSLGIVPRKEALQVVANVS